ncbi:MAG TPA: RagB/SusD family nutrient uptake outer membrane protein [Cyclobacteriaceae bacterium]
MKKNTINYAILVITLSLASISCKDQLDVGNPNAPTITANVKTEVGLVSLAQGGVYINGFKNGDNWLGDSYFSLPWGYQEIMADVVGADASNNQVSTLGVPDYYILNGSKVPNTSSSSVDIIHSYNTRAATGAGNNPIYFQWLNMYALNSACNNILKLVEEIEFSGDAESRRNTIRAWAYWWKGYAYASIGSMYYSGLIMNEPGIASNEYVLHDVILAESDRNFNLVRTTLDAITSEGDYTELLGQLIPAFTQVGRGGVLTRDMWKRNVNTMLARNILFNKLAPFVNGNPAATISRATISPMTPADWTTVKNLTSEGIRKSDFIFTGRATGQNDFFTVNGGSVASLTATVNTSSTFKITERFIQYFNAGDKRLDNNFEMGTEYKNSFTTTTRYSMIDGGAKEPGVHVYGSLDPNEYELIIAGSYEENALMLAEANIRTGNIDAGLALVDEVRTYFGAGLPAVSGKGLSLSSALNELVKERRTTLVFRGISYFDSRRYGWIYDISNGGGSYGNRVVLNDLSVHDNVTINYNFMDYWDLPADETVLNPPSATSAAVKNPLYE